jgi:glucose-1-phosphate cytidylyltransferase
MSHVPKVVILAGGLGSRLFEETITTPKPLVEIQGQAIIWHIMSRFAAFGFTDFIICLGHKSDEIVNYFSKMKHTVLSEHNDEKLIQPDNKWKINLIDTGKETMTGGRVKRIEKQVDDDFFVTYADHLSDVNLEQLYSLHKKQSTLCTLTVVNPTLNYGVVSVEGNAVKSFAEKPLLSDTLINAGYFVCKKEMLALIKDDASVFEIDVMQKMLSMNQLSAYKHGGFWKCIDTYKDLTEAKDLPLSQLIKNG